jgi:hypothetical protein
MSNATLLAACMMLFRVGNLPNFGRPDQPKPIIGLYLRHQLSLITKNTSNTHKHFRVLSLMRSEFTLLYAINISFYALLCAMSLGFYTLYTHCTYYAIRQQFANRRTRKSLKRLKIISFKFFKINLIKYKIISLIYNSLYK